MSQIYMTATLKLPDGTIVYPQVTLDNMLRSLTDHTAVTMAAATDCFNVTAIQASANIYDPSGFEANCYYWNGKQTNTNYNSTGLIPVTPGTTIYSTRGNKTVAAGRALVGMRFVTAYDAQGNWLQDKSVNASTPYPTSYAVPEGVAYIRISDGYVNANDPSRPDASNWFMVQTSSTVVDWVPYVAAHNEYILKADCNNDTHIGSVVDTKLVPVNADIDAVEGDVSALQANYEQLSGGGLNLFDKTKTTFGSYYWTDGPHVNASYNYTGLFEVKPGTSLWWSVGYLTAAQGRSIHGFRFIVFFGQDGTTQVGSAQSTSSSTGCEVPSNAYYAIASVQTSTYGEYNMIQTTGTAYDYVPYDPYWTTYYLKNSLLDPKGIAKIVRTNTDHQGVWTATTPTLIANTNLVCCDESDNKKNEYIEVFANFTAFTGLHIMHGFGVYGGGWVRITDTNVDIMSYDGSTVVETFTHGLTMTDFIHVMIYTKNESNCRSSISIMTAGGDWSEATTRYYSCRGPVSCKTPAGSADLTNVKMTFTINDMNKPVWVFGDSYLSFGDPNKWSTQFVGAGHKNALFCGFGGATSANEIIPFRAMMAVNPPKFVVWCLGMNDGDTNDTVNANWKTYVDEVIATCQEKGTVPILATIPNVPTVVNTYKNAYVKSTGCRYVDFAHAVNAEATGATWYTGMLSNDGVHPALLGAKALMRQFMLDVPEAISTES